MNDVDSMGLVLTGVSKTFPGQRALDGVDLHVAGGEVHGLIGQNGSGKSTLVKVLAGYHRADPGAEITVWGQPVALGTPGASFSAGMRFVHQDLGLVSSLSVADNFFLDSQGNRALTPLRRGAERDAVATAIAALGHEIDPRALVGDLSPSSRTIVAVARALQDWRSAARVLVIDEATASMPWAEARSLLDAISRVAATGVAVILVSHHLDEVLSTTDRVTVLRDGRKVATFTTADIGYRDLAGAMLGRELMNDVTTVSHAPRAGQEPLCVVQGLTGATVGPIDFAVQAGEVLGIAGITGSGREEVAGLVAGSLPRDGSVTVAGRTVPPMTPSRAIAAGICMVPADRMAQALVTRGTVRENLTIADLASVSWWGGLSRSRERVETRRWAEALSLSPADPEMAVSALSGGSQQKVVLARWLRVEPRVLLLDEPTQGVDIGAQVEIHHQVDAVAARGAAVIVCSTDASELARLCDRVLILSRGRTVEELVGADVTVEAIELAQLGIPGADPTRPDPTRPVPTPQAAEN